MFHRSTLLAMRTVVLVAALALVACQKDDQPKGSAPVPQTLPADAASIWTTPIKTLDGKDTTLAAFKGKEILVVNVASKCGLTPQCAHLEALQKKYEGKGFTVV